MFCNILITNCEMLTPELSVRSHASVAISGPDIIEIGDTDQMVLNYQAEQVIDGTNRLLMPGFIDGHTHSCQQLLRGRPQDEYPMLWTRILVPFESSLTPDDVYYSSQLACVEMIKNGTTTFADAGGIHMDMVAESVRESGMRAVLCRSTMDQGDVIPKVMKETPEEAIANTEKLYKVYQGADERIDIWFGLRQILTCSSELIRRTAERAAELKTGIHTHLCENKNEVSYCLQNYKKRPAAVFDEYGALGTKFIAAHSVLLSESDITLLKKRDVKIIHCPRSNLNNHGIPNTPRLLETGLSVGFGTDGSAMGGVSLFDDLKTFRCAMNAQWGSPVLDPLVMPCKNLLRHVTMGGATAIGHEKDIGTIEVGKRADLILLNLNQAHIRPTHDLLNTVAVSAQGSDVTDSIIHGKVVMRNRQLTTLDEEKILAECKKRKTEIAHRAGIANH